MKNKLIILSVALFISLAFIGCARYNNEGLKNKSPLIPGITKETGRTAGTHEITGAYGTAGPNGITGPNGVTGPNGITGPNGTGIPNGTAGAGGILSYRSSLPPAFVPQSVTKDNVRISLLNAKVETIKGTHDVKGTAVNNGKYFKLGADLKKVSDHKKIAIKIRLENNNTGPVEYSKSGWKFSDQNGKLLEYNIAKPVLSPNQISAKDSIEENIDLYVKKNINVSKILASYNSREQNIHSIRDVKLSVGVVSL